MVRILVRKRNVDGGSRHTVRVQAPLRRIAFRWSPDWRHLCSKKHGKGHIGEPIVFQFHSFLRKEVIQPQVPLRLPCYDFTPVEDPTVVCANKTTKSLCGTSGTQKSWVIIGPMLRAKPIPRV